MGIFFLFFFYWEGSASVMSAASFHSSRTIKTNNFIMRHISQKTGSGSLLPNFIADTKYHFVHQYSSTHFKILAQDPKLLPTED